LAAAAAGDLRACLGKVVRGPLAAAVRELRSKKVVKGKLSFTGEVIVMMAQMVGVKLHPLTHKV